MEFNAKKKGATPITKAKNEALAKRLGIDIQNATCHDLELAKSHQLKKIDDLTLIGKDGRTVWDLEKYNFYLEDAVPASINPSLWLNGKSTFQTGVFSVVGKDIIQVRGFDIANLTVVRSKTGWIVVDTLTTVEMSRAALEQIEDAIGEEVRSKVRAVILSHSHTDHFGGIKGVVDEDRVGPASEGKVPIYVPDGFEGATINENLYGGTASNRRCDYQFARSEPAGTLGTVSTGIGLGYGRGTISYIKPTNIVDHDQTIEIDGIKVDFMLAPNTEAPAEMNNYFHNYRALWMAEICTGTMHNLYPIRGTKVRDAVSWSYYINDALKRYGDISDVVFQSHNWPHWNTPETPNAVKDFLRNSAAIYKYVHDQTLLYANMGYTPREIAKKIQIPKGLEQCWYVRPYYGSLEINARAVYQFYLGYFDGNPVNLVELTNEEEAKKFVEYVGSEERVLEKAAEDYEKGEYQSAAAAANKVVFVNPENMQARYLCADALEQLGYQAESAILRNAYLVGASELRVKKHGDPARDFNTLRNLYGRQGDILKTLDPGQLLDYLGIVIDSDQDSEDMEFILDVYFSPEKKEKETFLVNLFSGILLHSKIEKLSAYEECLPKAAITRNGLVALAWKDMDALKKEYVEDADGCIGKIADLIVRLSDDAAYPIIEP